MSDTHRPQRGDDVEAWLRRWRDRQLGNGEEAAYLAIDKMLDRYRECADYGLTLRPADKEAGDP